MTPFAKMDMILNVLNFFTHFDSNSKICPISACALL